MTGAASRRGQVWLVGAGPGAADLITVRGLRALRRADVLLLDALLPRGFLDGLGVSSRGKTVLRTGDCGAPPTPEAALRRAASAAAAGLSVARVQVGDPGVFGRAAEAIRLFDRLGIPWEIIPGPSACTAGPTAAGLPITRRGAGRSFAVATARSAGGARHLEFPRADSLVVLMGVEALPDAAHRLLRDGWPPSTPATVVERAAMPLERRVRGTLASIAAEAERAGIASPAFLLVGAAAVPVSPRPRILFTGLDPSRFRGLGDLLHWPALRLVPDEAGRAALRGVLRGWRLRRHSRVVFTDALAVRSFFDALAEEGADARALASARIDALQEGAVEALAEFGLRPDAPFPAAEGEAVLLVGGSHVSSEGIRRFRAAGCEVTALAPWRAVPNPELGRPLPAHDAVYFVSPSGVRAFASIYGRSAFEQEAWCLGEAVLVAVGRQGGRGRIVWPPGGLAEIGPWIKPEDEPLVERVEGPVAKGKACLRRRARVAP